MEAIIVDVVLIVVGMFAAFVGFGGAMTDGATPAWAGPTFVAGGVYALLGATLDESSG